jgi:ribonuclease VapC
MIALDTSALIAIFFKEPEADGFLSILDQNTIIYISAGSYVELHSVLHHKKRPEIIRKIDQFMEEAGIRIHPVTQDQAIIARQAYVKYSALNFGDSFSYALAKDLDIPLLFKGDDFPQTDIQFAG